MLQRHSVSVCAMLCVRSFCGDARRVVSPDPAPAPSEAAIGIAQQPSAWVHGTSPFRPQPTGLSALSQLSSKKLCEKATRCVWNWGARRLNVSAASWRRHVRPSFRLAAVARAYNSICSSIAA